MIDYSKETKAIIPFVAIVVLLSLFETLSFSFAFLLLSLSFIYIKYYEGLRFESIGVAFEHFIFRASLVGVVIYILMVHFGAAWLYPHNTISLFNVLFVSISETFFWIGIVQRKLQEKHFGFGLFLASVLFAISHANFWYFSGYSLNILSSFLIALLLGYLYNITSRIYTGNIFPPMVARIVFNILLFLR